jgi:4'-phosphopantetheinyl transferase
MTDVVARTGAELRGEIDRPVVCDVWWADIAAAGPGLEALVSAADRDRIARFRVPADRDRGLVAWALARLLLADRLGGAPSALAIDRTCRLCGCANGKPRVTDPAEPVDFSVSHSGDHVVVAITGGAPIGADIERLRATTVDDALLRTVLTPHERAGFDGAHDDAARDDAFIRLWVRKEAVVKMVETGLRTPMRGFAVSPADAPPALLSWPDDATLPGRTTLADLAGRPGHLGAVAVLGDGVTVREHDGTERLRAESA